MQAASYAVQSLVMTQAKASGLGLLEFLLLARAGDGEGVVPMDVGRPLGLHSGTLTGLADRLERDKLLRRTPHPSDRRLIVLRATAKGRNLRARALAPTLAQLNEIAGALDPAQRALVAGFLRQVVSVVAEQAAGASTRPARQRSRGRSIPRRPRPRSGT